MRVDRLISLTLNRSLAQSIIPQSFVHAQPPPPTTANYHKQSPPKPQIQKRDEEGLGSDTLHLDFNAGYWEGHYQLVPEHTPTFLERWAPAILTAGKYLSIVRQCHRMDRGHRLGMDMGMGMGTGMGMGAQTKRMITGSSAAVAATGDGDGDGDNDGGGGGSGAGRGGGGGGGVSEGAGEGPSLLVSFSPIVGAATSATGTGVGVGSGAGPAGKAAASADGSGATTRTATGTGTGTASASAWGGVGWHSGHARVRGDLIMAAHHTASSALLTLLMAEESAGGMALMHKLRMMKHFFLMDQGDFFIHFLDLAGADMERHASQLEPARLESLLQLAVQTSSIGQCAGAATATATGALNTSMLSNGSGSFGSGNGNGFDSLSCSLSRHSLLRMLERIHSSSSSSSSSSNDTSATTAAVGPSSLDEGLRGFEAFTLEYHAVFPLSLVVSRKVGGWLSVYE